MEAFYSDFARELEQRIAALPLGSIELTAVYCQMSATTIRRALAGTVPNADVLNKIGKTLDTLERLKTGLHPTPLDFSEVGRIKILLQGLENGTIFFRTWQHELAAR